MPNQDLDRRAGPTEGLLAALALALADLAAAGPWRTPWILAGLTLLLAPALGALAGRILLDPGRTRGLVLATGLGLTALSHASKDLAGAPLAVGLGSGAALTLGAWFALRPRAARAQVFLAAAMVPCSSFLFLRIEDLGAAAAFAFALPLVAALFAAAAPPRGRLVPALALAAYPLLALPAALEHRPTAHAPEGPLGDVPHGSPSVVLLLIDTLRHDALDLTQAPAFAPLAREGIVFRQAISAAPWTLPAVSSLLTGLYPSQHGAISARTPLPSDVTTLAEHLRARGYDTAAFTGGAFVGPTHRLDQGFATFESDVERRVTPFRPYVPLLWRLAKNRFAPQRWLIARVDEYRGLEGAVEAVGRWGRPDRTRPFFLFVHTYQAHDYYLYDPNTDEEVRSRPGAPARFASRMSVHPSELVDASPDELAWFRSIYAARIEALQSSVLALREEVQRLLDGEPVIWVVTSDHGEGFDAERHRVHHGGRLHDDLLRVPLLLSAPFSLAGNRVIEDQVATVDLVPTLLELCGAPIPTGLAGRSLLSGIRGEAPFPVAAFGEERALDPPQIAVRREGWKLLRRGGQETTYHVAEDPEEREPTAGPGELGAALERFFADFPPRQVEGMDLDQATLEHLRDLGYVE